MIKNKRGDIVSLIFVFVILFVSAFVFIFVAKINDAIMPTITSAVGNSSTIGGNATRQVANDTNNMLDSLFMFIFMGFFIAILISFYYLQVPPVFYVIFILLGTLILVSVIPAFSNFYEQTGLNSEINASISSSRFPMQNWIMGNLPLVFIVVLGLSIVILYAKSRGGNVQPF